MHSIRKKETLLEFKTFTEKTVWDNTHYKFHLKLCMRSLDDIICGNPLSFAAASDKVIEYKSFG
jgi:hypothetical protein